MRRMFILPHITLVDTAAILGVFAAGIGVGLALSALWRHVSSGGRTRGNEK